jgi:DNA-binding PadR family transcriptional regulator
MALAPGERHGYAIILDVQERTGGDLTLGAGALYRALHRMLEQGLVTESARRPAARLDDERRRYYRITPLGMAVARAETLRLTQLVRMARAQGLRPEEAR